MKIDIRSLFAMTMATVPTTSEVTAQTAFSRFSKAHDGWNVLLDHVSIDLDDFSVLSVRGPERDEITLLFDTVVRCDEEYIIIRMNDEDELYLVSLPIYARSFDAQGRICHEQKCEVTMTESSMTISPGELSCCFNVFCAKSIMSLVPPGLFNVERRVFSLYGKNTLSPLSLNSLLIEGRIYDPRPQRRAGAKRICQEQAAHLLYTYYNILGQVTGKQIYRAMQVVVAYAAALRLRPDGLLPHGAWSDEMETHWRYAAEALELFTTHYREFGGDLIADACKTTAQVIIRNADNLENNGLWFPHDTIEMSAMSSKGYPTLVASRAFGKNPGNTLTLNTHICSLLALLEYERTFGDNTAKPYIERAKESLRRVMNAQGGDVVFRLLYQIHDAIWQCDNAAVSVLLRILHKLLLYAKKLWPRIVMPNGAIERDLSASSFSRRYHNLNIRDLLKMMASDEGMSSMRAAIRNGILYAERQGLHQHDIFGYSGGRYWAEILLSAFMLADADDSKRSFLDKLCCYGARLRQSGLFWPVDILTDFPEHAEWELFYRDLNPEHDFFCCRSCHKTYGILFGGRECHEPLAGKTLSELSSTDFAVWEIM